MFSKNIFQKTIDKTYLCYYNIGKWIGKHYLAINACAVDIIGYHEVIIFLKSVLNARVLIGIGRGRQNEGEMACCFYNHKHNLVICNSQYLSHWEYTSY